MSCEIGTGESTRINDLEPCPRNGSLWVFPKRQALLGVIQDFFDRSPVCLSSAQGQNKEQLHNAHRILFLVLECAQPVPAGLLALLSKVRQYAVTVIG